MQAPSIQNVLNFLKLSNCRETQDLCEGCLSFHPRAKFKTYTSLQYSLPKSTQSETCIFVQKKKGPYFPNTKKHFFKNQPTTWWQRVFPSASPWKGLFRWHLKDVDVCELLTCKVGTEERWWVWDGIGHTCLAKP